MTEKTSVAIIGAGISGLAAGWLLSQDDNYHVTIFDSLNKNGLDFQGLDVPAGDLIFQNTAPIRIDVPFRFHTPNIYINFTQMCSVLGVETHKYEQDILVCDRDGNTIMNYTTIQLLGYSIPWFYFRNFITIKFWTCLWDLYWFRKTSWVDYNKGLLDGISFGAYLDQKHPRHVFQDYLLSYLSLVCTCSFQVLRDYPCTILVRFLHDMTAGVGLYQFTHGTKDIADRLEKPIGCRQYDTTVVSVYPSGSKVCIQLKDGSTTLFDRVILATQPDVTAKLLEGRPDLLREMELLLQFPVVQTAMTIHTDASVLPPTLHSVRPHDAPKNVLQISSDGSFGHKILNRAYPFMAGVTDPLLVQTWGLHNPALPQSVIHTCNMKRQVFTVASLSARRELLSLQGQHNVWFCGGYTIETVPLLESGVCCAAEVVRSWGVRIPWDFVSLPAPVPSQAEVPLPFLFAAVCAMVAAVASS